MNNKIILYNGKKEDHSSEPNNFYLEKTKSGNPLANPFGVGGKRPSFVKMSFPTVEEANEAYKEYFNEAYGTDANLTIAFDEIYEHYKNGEDIYLQCMKDPKKSHGNFLIEQLQKKLIKEKMKERNNLNSGDGGKN